MNSLILLLEQIQEQHKWNPREDDKTTTVSQPALQHISTNLLSVMACANTARHRGLSFPAAGVVVSTPGTQGEDRADTAKALSSGAGTGGDNVSVTYQRLIW